MSRSKNHQRRGEAFAPLKSIQRESNAYYKRRRQHQERTQLRNELADLPRYQDDLDREFIPWDKYFAKNVKGYWY